MPPNIPRKVKRAIEIVMLGKIPSNISKKPIINPQLQERPNSIFPLDNFPAKKEPMVIPKAVDKKRYPPPTSSK